MSVLFLLLLHDLGLLCVFFVVFALLVLRVIDVCEVCFVMCVCCWFVCLIVSSCVEV